MEEYNNDDMLEDYFFKLTLNKEIILNSLIEIFEICLKENDEIEDELLRDGIISDSEKEFVIDPLDIKTTLNKTVGFLPGIRKFFEGKYDILKGLPAEDRIYIGKLLFGKGFNGIAEIRSYMKQDIIEKMPTFKNDDIFGQGVVFRTILGLIKSLINVEDNEFTAFLMNERKEIVETELLYAIEKALKYLESNARALLLNFRSATEKVLMAEDFLTEIELNMFKTELIRLSDETIEAFKSSGAIDSNMQKFNEMRAVFNKMINLR